MHWSDLDAAPLREGLPPWRAFPGLEIRVEMADAMADGIRFESATPWHHALRYRDLTLLWFSLQDGWDFPEYLRGSTPLTLFPPITASQVRQAPPAGTPDWWRHWTKHYVEAAVSAHALSPSDWWCHGASDVAAPASPHLRWPGPPEPRIRLPPVPHDARRVLEFPEFWDELPYEATAPLPGALLPLRRPAGADHARLKSWRKIAREGRLPPALGLYHALMQRYFVLDGHDRIHAALEEGVPAPMLTLMHVWSDTDSAAIEFVQSLSSKQQSELYPSAHPQMTDSVNALLRRGFGEHIPFTVTRTRPYRGGVIQWRTDVRRRLAEIGQTVEPEVIKRLLNPPLTPNGAP